MLNFFMNTLSADIHDPHFEKFYEDIDEAIENQEFDMMKNSRLSFANL